MPHQKTFQEIILNRLKPKTHLSSAAQQNIAWSYYLGPNTLEQRSTTQRHRFNRNEIYFKYRSMKAIHPNLKIKKNKQTQFLISII